MRQINALSLAPDVNDWLTNSRCPRVLHIFDHACNLINERGEVLSIVTPKIGNGPFNLVVAEDVLFSERISLDSSFSNSPNRLDLGDLTTCTESAKLWSPRPDWEMLHEKRDEILKPLTQLPVPDYRISNSLISSLANAALPASLAATRKIAGLGIGLTPSGDDFIVGAVLAAWIIHPVEIARGLATEITNVASPLTTSLSAAYLKSAGKGEAGILWHDFFYALTFGDSSAIESQFAKLISIGHTSGAEALAGFVGIFKSYAESETISCPF